MRIDRGGLLAGIAIAILAGACASPPSPSPVVSAGPTVTAPTSAGPTTQPSTQPASANPTNLSIPLGDWIRRIDPTFIDPLGETGIQAIAAGPQGYIATGIGPAGGAIWRTTSSVDWQRADLGGLGSEPIVRPTADEHGYVAVGHRLLGSHDGLSWHALATPKGLAIESGVVLAFFGGKLLAFGLEPDSQPTREWSSEDRGATWTLTRAVFPGATEVRSVRPLPDGRLVAVGGSQDSPGAWISSDGTAWKALDAPFAPAVENPAMDVKNVTWNAIATDDAGVTVVVGTDGGHPEAVVSRDGRTWTRADLPGYVDTREVSVDDVASIGRGFVAVGPGPTGRVGLWWSPDGTTWTLEPVVPAFDGPEGEFAPTSVSAIDEHIVIGGEYPRPADVAARASAVTWITPVTGLDSWVEPTGCPTTIDVASVGDTGAVQRPGCFKGSITIDGVVGDFGDCECDDVHFFLLGPALGQSYIVLPVYPYSAHGANAARWSALVGHHLRVTGRFDDPTARTCSSTDVGFPDGVKCVDRFVAHTIVDLGR